ncbi:MAG TPA: hypothetical protein VFI73_06610 [Candidatus Nitrosopolaris sp.]|nr:hypothetical protein [Candidatus Nitrosopolaris sp.]
MALSYDKISRFVPNAAYRFRKLDELNDLTDAINASKFRVSSGLQYYLQKYRQLLDIPRLCRALALPGKIAENFMEDKKVKQNIESLNDLGYLTNKIVHILEKYVKNENGNLITAVDLNNNQREAVYTDINELGVYLKMYYDIETVKRNPWISNEYPSGNPFDDVVEIMNNGAIIIRFKFVSRDESAPQEKLVSYHLMDFKDKRVLGVHIQDDPKFSLYKQWGQGDERLVPIYPEYNNTIIRWGKEEVLEYILKGNEEDGREFLY